MENSLIKLLAKKRYWGFLEGNDAREFLKHVRATGDASGKWSESDLSELTRWQLGLPTAVKFQIVAGPPNAKAPELRTETKAKMNGGRPRLTDRECLDSRKSRREYQRELMRSRRNSKVLAKNPQQAPLFSIG